MPKAIAFGTFDGFHPGHKFYLDAATVYGDLTVVVARDATVEKVKGKLPRRNETERLADLQAAGYNAILGGAGDKYAVLSEIKPDVICLGYDQGAFTEKLPNVLAERGLEAEIVRLPAFHPETYKSSLLNR